MKFGAVTIPKGYESAFQRAIWTFRHQRVFDDLTKQIVHLTPLPEGGLASPPGIPEALPEDDTTLTFLGPQLSDEVASRIASGELPCGSNSQQCFSFGVGLITMRFLVSKLEAVISQASVAKVCWIL